MIDLHTHILPGVDDGADRLETSISMLRMAKGSGVTALCATPHFDRASGYENYVTDALEESFLKLEAEAWRMGIKLLRGMEILAGDDVPALLEARRLWTLGGTRYFLTEFSFTEDPDYCRIFLADCAKRGFLPVIAHPERYRFIQREPQIAYEWCRSGYGLQINKGSLLGRFGEESKLTALRLIGHGLAACIASDAHGAHRRTTHMTEVWELLKEDLGEEYAELLLERNPARILAGRELMGYEPYPFI